MTLWQHSGTPADPSAPPTSGVAETHRTREVTRASVPSSPSLSSAGDREASLKQLYEARAELNRARRLGKASDADLETLTDLNAYIDDLERADAKAGSEHLWAKLDVLARSLLELQADIERAK